MVKIITFLTSKIALLKKNKILLQCFSLHIFMFWQIVSATDLYKPSEITACWSLEWLQPTSFICITHLYLIDTLEPVKKKCCKRYFSRKSFWKKNCFLPPPKSLMVWDNSSLAIIFLVQVISHLHTF